VEGCSWWLRWPDALGQNVEVDPHAPLEIVDALTVSQLSDATELVVEYMALTFNEVGLPVPAPSELPEDWRREVADLAAAYPPPGTFLVAYRGQRPIGGVGIQVREPGTVEVRHLYVRPGERGGVGRLLMDQLHRRAADGGIRRLVLDVLTSRTHAIDFYRRLGYTDAEPFTVVPVPVIFMELLLR
jgi:GNAT superfamily N-acetyltransferase